MIIQCPCCGERIEVVAELAIGQHVVCPYCGQKFSYGIEAPDRVVHAKASPSPIRGFIDAHRKLLYGVIASLIAVLLLLSGMSMFGVFDKVKVKLEDESVNPMTCDFGGELSFCISRAKIGAAYFYAASDVRVSYVIPKKGVLATDGKVTIYVETDRMYVDGATLMTALYTCVGRATVTKANGDQVVAMAFEEVDEQTGKKRMEMVYKQIAEAEKAKKKAEEDARVARAEEEIKLKAEREKAEAELAAQKAANDRKLAQLRAEQERKAEAERVEREKKAEAERIAEEKKQAEEAKRRYPIEQKERAAYAAMKLEKIQFGYKQRFFVTESVRRIITSFKLNEKKWGVVQNLIVDKKYLNALSEINDGDLADYPDTNTIDSMIQQFLKRTFHVEMKLSRKDWPLVCLQYNSSEQVTAETIRFGRDLVFDNSVGRHGYANDWSVWEFEITLADDSNILIFDCPHGTVDGIPSRCSESLSQRVHEIKAQIASGKIEQREADALMVSAYRKSINTLLGRVSVLERESQKKKSLQGTVSETSTKTVRYVTCQECTGTGRKICSQCEGKKTIAITGEYRAGLNGQNLSMRSKKSCPSCKGEGKTWCKSCKGRGKVSVNYDK